MTTRPESGIPAGIRSTGTEVTERRAASAPRGRSRPWAVRARRLRGGVLRLARSRSAAFAAGSALLAPAIALMAADHPWESWLTDGLGLAGLATGAALILTALGGRRPDWIDPA